jgi:hypothetical protein
MSTSTTVFFSSSASTTAAALTNTTTATPETTSSSSLGFSIDVTFVLQPWVVVLTGILGIFSCVLSYYDMKGHAEHFTHPRLQRTTLRIMLMIPIYAILSWASIAWPHYAFFIATIRDTYESFVLYQFLTLLILYAGGETQLIVALSEKRYKGVHPAPCCLLPMFPLDKSFYVQCKRMVLQYALMKPITSFLALFGSLTGMYSETNYNWGSNFYPWCLLANNIGLTWALWYLVVFHNETERELGYCRPMIKFMCIKSIIFFAYWQSMCMGMIVNSGLIYTGSTDEERELVVGAIQEFLICLELPPVAYLHHLAFSYEGFEEEMRNEPVYETADLATMQRAKKLKQEEEKRRLQLIASGVVPVGAVDAAAPTTTATTDQTAVEVPASRAITRSQAAAEEAGGRADEPVAFGSNGIVTDIFSEVLALGDFVKDTVATLFVREGGLMDAIANVAGGGGGANGGGAGDDDEDGGGAANEAEAEGIAMHRAAHGAESESESSSDDADDDEDDDADGGDRVIIKRIDHRLAAVFQKLVMPIYETVEATTAQLGGGMFCVVCGRSDRDLVKRKSGYKCKQCVGAHGGYSAAAARAAGDLADAQARDAR